MSNQLPVAVLGYGVTGRSVVRHLRRCGRPVLVLDTRAAPADAGSLDFDCMWQVTRWPGLQVEYAVVSPGLSLDSCLVRSARAAGVILRSDIDLFFDAVRAPVIGITGTNGKSTVTALVGHILECGGFDTGVGGNLGDAALDLLDDRRDYYVLELSSFQLERSGALGVAAAVLLNVSQDHLDEHGDMASYTAAKQRIFDVAERCVFNRGDPATRPAGDAVSFGLDAPSRPKDWGVLEGDDGPQLGRGEDMLCAIGDLPLKGGHNVANMLAACALVDGLVKDATLVAGLATFAGLEHRFVEVAVVDGVVYVNDSKATNVGATAAALEGLDPVPRVILIGGGDAKGADLAPLADLLKSRVRHVVALGKDGAALTRVAADAGVEAELCDDIARAVARAAAVARPGDMVLLSPACSSLDMFENYADRGNQFARAVHRLEAS